MNATIALIPVNSDQDIFSLPIEKFKAQMAVGAFLPDEVYAYWANDTHYDSAASVFTVPQPPEATRVAVLPIPLGSAINATTQRI